MKISASLKSLFAKRPVKSPQAAANPPATASREFSSPHERIRATGQFGLDDIPLIVETISKYDIARGTPWDDLRHGHLKLPDWFRTDLDPFSPEYAEQQHRLWAIARGVDREYQPDIDEKEAPLSDVDPVRRPGCFVRRDREAVEGASHHIIAEGMILKHSGLKPGDSALEYGAGFAHAALTLARLGVKVDTVDISETFCRHVRAQADFFQVPLTPFHGRFGMNPRGQQKYDLIWFYESFHHCVDFQAVVRNIKQHLAPGGRILLVGEPIPKTQNLSVPYPWGLRLNSEPLAQTRRFGWFELGFTEDFLAVLFTRSGFSADRIECPMTQHGEGYKFTPRGHRIEVGSQWQPHDIRAGWHAPESGGRWTTQESILPLDCTDSFRELEIEATNHHPFTHSLELAYGDDRQVFAFNKGERKRITIGAAKKAPSLIFKSRVFVPATNYKLKSADQRALGIFVHSVQYNR